MVVKTAVARTYEATLSQYGRFLEPILQIAKQEHRRRQLKNAEAGDEQIL